MNIYSLLKLATMSLFTLQTLWNYGKIEEKGQIFNEKTTRIFYILEAVQ